jgi:hypothetical protein
MTLFQSLILFTNHYGNLQEMLKMASFLKYVDLYLTSECGRFYVGHSVFLYLQKTWCYIDSTFLVSNKMVNKIK